MTLSFSDTHKHLNGRLLPCSLLADLPLDVLPLPPITDKPVVMVKKQKLQRPSNDQITDLYIKRSKNSCNASLVNRALSILVPEFKKQGRFKVRINELIDSISRKSSRLPNTLTKFHENNKPFQLEDGRKAMAIVRLHASGAAISRAINAAVQICSKDDRIEIYKTTTSSEETVDTVKILSTGDSGSTGDAMDVENKTGEENGDGNETTKDRMISAVHITLVSIYSSN